MTTTVASASADQASQNSWKESAGRTDGHEGYQFGDFSRSAVASTRSFLSKGSEKLRRWSENGKTKEGYEFGDVFLKDLVRGVFRSSDRPTGDASTVTSAPEPSDADESEEHRSIAAAMREQLQSAMHLMETNLPRIEQRLQELKSRTEELNGQEKSEIYRIEVGNPLCPCPIKKYRQALDELRSAASMRLDGCFVRCAESCGDLKRIQESLAQASKVAEECSRCAKDVCPPLEEDSQEK